MRTDLSPWFEGAMEAGSLQAVRAADPRDATVQGLASSPRGPFRAWIRRRGEHIGFGQHPVHPELAIARAVEQSLEGVR